MLKTSNQNLRPFPISPRQLTAAVHCFFLEKSSDQATPRPPGLMLVLAAICSIFFLTSCMQDRQILKIYPAPDGIELSKAFIVKVEDQGVPVYKTKIPPEGPVPRLNHSRREFGFASFALFDMGEKVEIEVIYPEAVHSVKILPTSFGIKPNIEGNSLFFALDEPGNLTIEVNDDWHESLHIFANPLEEDIPDPHDPNVIWFGPGIHDVSIEGVTICDPSHWTIPIQASDNIHVDNIKIIGWRGNSDGVDISNSRDALIENCFMRTLDDAVVIKSFEGRGEVRNIHTRKCVIWNELAHSLSIGAEVRENVSQVLFEDCDIIHDVGRETALRVYHCDDALISDVTFQNIRIEEARRLISCWIGKTRWTKTEERGNIRNVTFRDIVATSAPIDTTLTGFQDGPDWKPYLIRNHASMELIGYDEDHTIKGVFFEDVLLDGRQVVEEQVTINDFVREVQFQ